MDESQFRQVLRSSNPHPCAFGKAILARRCACPLAQKRHIAERESVLCTDANAHANCMQLHNLLRHHSAFALKHIHDNDPFTHAQEMKVQCGGLLGLQRALDDSDEITDVAALVDAARQKFGSLEELPYALIIRSVAAAKVRVPSKGDKT